MSSRTKILIGAWKAYLNNDAAVRLARHLADYVDGRDLGFELAVCPSFISIASVKWALEGSTIEVGAQNVFLEPDNGAYTSHITAEQLAGLGCAYVILGHSEVRELDGETDEKVNRRTHTALSRGLRPIVCIGESAAERAEGAAKRRVEEQVLGALRDVPADALGGILLAYEPVWAITSASNPDAVPATVEQAVEMHAHIREVLRDDRGAEAAAGARILYGGSVKPANAGSFIAEEDIDGLLVGSASVKAESFEGLIEAVSKSLRG